jgi:hypothetical protein
MQKLERVAFSIQEFCFRNNISPPTYHKLKRAGRAPKEMRLGPALVRITLDAEAQWQRARTNAPNEPEIARAVARSRKAGQLAVQSPLHVSKRGR